MLVVVRAHAMPLAGRNIRIRRIAFALAAVCLCGRTAGAQLPSSMAAERDRLAQIIDDTTHGLPASDSALTALGQSLPGARRLRGGPVSLVAPEVRIVWNHALPHSMNDGALWAGRGWSFGISGGLAARFQAVNGPVVQVVLAPALLYSQNAPFQVFPSLAPGRSSYANPFHGPEASLDLPHRFGDRHLLYVDGGRSRISVEWPRVVAGVTTENEWWGPGLRNALVMSNNAPGIPRIFVRTAAPVRTLLGSVDAELISGALTQSRFFSRVTSENRTLSGLRVRLRPAFDSTLAFGVARVVYAPVGPEASPFTSTLARSFDALARWENLSAPDDQRSDQITSLFARWFFPRAGMEVYGEWARMDLPRNVGELLVASHHTGAWTLGLQWAKGLGRDRHLRLQSELTYLEQSRVLAGRATPDFYSGLASPHGYTQRGQIIGAAIGPGASSQWLALDWLDPRRQLGVHLGRIRWDNDAMYRQPSSFWDHDVSILAGLRAGWRAPLTDMLIEITTARRYNYLFQNGFNNPGGYRTVDVDNVTVALTVTPR